MDITQLILDDHQEQRRLFALLDQFDRTQTEALSTVWKHLEAVLLVHAEAEERFFYPALLRVGKGAGGRESAAAETADAIKDHNKLRKAIARVATTAPGSDEWSDAVTAARVENSDHMGEEEREGLADFRRHASLEERHDLAQSFAVFQLRNVLGIRAVEKDPGTFIRDATGAERGE